MLSEQQLGVVRVGQEVGRVQREVVSGSRIERALQLSTLQVVDATTDVLTLQNGDILVLSTEGVARAFELEIGAPVYGYEELNHQRPPQLEDYVGVP